MSLMVDKHMDKHMEVDMDDLFGDGAALMSQPHPPPKKLFKRIDQLRTSGCHQTTAWSRQGCIASITPDGSGLELQNLRVHPKGGSWGLSDAYVVPQVATSLPGHGSVPLQHLSWSPSGQDLAVIDAAGRIAILQFNYSLNRPVMTRQCVVDSLDELHGIVGTYWTNLPSPNRRSHVMQHTATRSASNEYTYEAASAEAFGPSMPQAGKSALICITTNGILRLLYSSDPQSYKWKDLHHEIDNIVSSDDQITHASICADNDNTLILAYATTSKQLRISRVHIRWVPPDYKPQPKANPAQIPIAPGITLTHQASTNWMDAQFQDGSDAFQLSPCLTSISHLKILSPCLETGPDTSNDGRPTIIAVRSHLPQSSSQYNQDTHSLITRWQLVEEEQKLHPAFEQVLKQSNGSVTKEQHRDRQVLLEKMDGISSNKVLTWLETIQLDRVLVLGYSDGSIEFRDRLSLDEITTMGSPERFNHLTQIGFGFGQSEPSLIGVLSPTGVSYIYNGADGKLRWKGLEYHGGGQDDSLYLTAIAGLNLSFSTAIMSGASYDDIIAVSGQLKQLFSNLSYDVISEISKTLKFHLDYTEDAHHETLIRNPSIQVALGIINAFGYNGDGRPRSFASLIAWITLHLRHSIILITVVHNMKVPLNPNNPEHKITGLEDADVVRVITGSIKWSLDLIAWIVDSLLHPNDPSEFDETFNLLTKSEPLDLTGLNNYLFRTNNVALHLLLASPMRGFLAAICRRLAHFDYMARRGMQNLGVNPGLRSAYMTLATLTSGTIIPTKKFEDFLNSIAANCKECYQNAGIPAGKAPGTGELTRNAVEQQILFGGQLPELLSSAITKIFQEDLPLLKQEIDPGQLFFHDFSTLSLPAKDVEIQGFGRVKDEETMRRKREVYEGRRVRKSVDVFSRKEVELGRELENGEGVKDEERQPKRWRRCVRCAAVMEDVLLKDNLPFQYLVGQSMRRCICNGTWDTLTGRRTVA